ncbi:MAG: peptidase S41 [Bacteroidia bacterium]|nr:MAG: peptidase S41 [Bacteroidia bacterium]PIE86466.1 MAG: peptidase S41 [Bacteroidia bacterium]
MKILRPLHFLFILFPLTVFSQNSAKWIRYPAISPDGKSILFSYQGDIYQVSANGGDAHPLTIHKAYEFRPVWSPDGQNIAFASDRYGDFDVFTMPAKGGKATRLTWHSAGQYPSSFSSDGKKVLFFAQIIDNPQNIQSPQNELSELYEVPVAGGRIKQILTTPAEEAKIDRQNKYIVYQDKKGYEDIWRKHHTSSVTRDVWLYDIEKKRHKKISDFKGEDLCPVIDFDGKNVYFLSEKSGTLNVFQAPVDSLKDAKQITFHENHPVRFLSISADNTLCYSFDGAIYVKKQNEDPRKINVNIFSGMKENATEYRVETSGATEMALSPDGNEIAFVLRGNIFVCSTIYSTTKQITDTPEQERSVSFSPDGRSLIYASERNGSWNIYTSKLTNEKEQNFVYASEIKEEALIETKHESFQPKFSPDGKEIAFLQERTSLMVYNIASKKTREVINGKQFYSYADGDQYYEWSPDGKWFLYSCENNLFISDVFLIDSQGKGKLKNLTQSGYNDVCPHWGLDGSMMYWFSDKEGMHKDVMWWGTQSNIYAMFFDREAYNRFKLTEEEVRNAEKNKPKLNKKQDIENAKNRSVKLNKRPKQLSASVLTHDGENIFYLGRSEKGYTLYKTAIRSQSTKEIAQFTTRRSLRMWKNAKDGSALHLSKDGKYLYVFTEGNIAKFCVSNEKKQDVNYCAEFILDKAGERAYIFNHAWKQVAEKFYKTDLHGLNWEFYKKAYEKFLPSISNNYDFAELLSEMLGELNASHTGCRYYKTRKKGNKHTASLAAFYDENYTGKGLKIAEIIEKSPLHAADIEIRKGMIIEKIEGVEILPETNFYKLLNHKTGKATRLTVYDPATKKRYKTVIKPISMYAEADLLYQRWIEKCRAEVEKLSKGKIGYVHVESMNDDSYRRTFSQLFGENCGKDAVVIDTRFNGGGWIHDNLSALLNGKRYLDFEARGNAFGSEPTYRWFKPSIVLMNEGNYSDANGFPYAYKKQNIGKLVGMPVPGTMTAVWWERQIDGTLVFGIPQMGTKNLKGEFLENKQLEPDVKIFNDFEKMAEGKDQQLEKAVEVLLKSIK